MSVKMKNALKDLTTAHFTKKYAKSENYIKNFFHIKAHFHNKSGKNVGHFI